MRLGETFGKYRLMERIASGGMAEVFKAVAMGEAGFEKPVAIKLLHRQYGDDEDLVAMLQDEARLCSLLHQGNICQVLDLGRVGDTYYIAMEYVNGKDLFTVLRRASQTDRVLPLPGALFVACEMLAGLDYAHRKRGDDGRLLQIIHRDISPQNVLITWDGEVKIIDFGIAKARTSTHKTQAGIIKGKFRYMSPEQARGEPIDHRTDIFATGVVLYEMILGRPHAAGATDREILIKIQSGQFERLGLQIRGLPAELEEMVHRALATNPESRWSSARAFRKALTTFMRSARMAYSKDELSEYVRYLFKEDTGQNTSIEASSVLSDRDILPGEDAAEAARDPFSLRVPVPDLSFSGPSPLPPPASSPSLDGRARAPFGLPPPGSPASRESRHLPAPLGSAPLGSAPLGSAPLGSAPLGSAPSGQSPPPPGPGSSRDQSTVVLDSPTGALPPRPGDVHMDTDPRSGRAAHVRDTDPRSGQAVQVRDTSGTHRRGVSSVVVAIRWLLLLGLLGAMGLGGYYIYILYVKTPGGAGSRFGLQKPASQGRTAPQHVVASFEIDSQPRGARILLNGQDMNQATPGVFRDLQSPAMVEIELRHPRFGTPWKRVVPVHQGDLVKLTADLAHPPSQAGSSLESSPSARPTSAGPRPRRGERPDNRQRPRPRVIQDIAGLSLAADEAMLTVTSEAPGAQVLINGVVRGTTPFQRRVRPATFQVQVARGSQKSDVRVVTLAPGKLQRLHFSLSP